MKYILEMTEDQARLLSEACEFYTRMLCGQWQELSQLCLRDFADPNFCARREELESLLLRARAYAFPDLNNSWGHHYGVGYSQASDMAWELHEVLRNRIAWTNHPEGGGTVDFGRPMSFSGYPLAECRTEAESCDGCKWKTSRHQKCSCCHQNVNMKDCYKEASHE